ncbi:ArsA family ATPase [Fuchsiella alkaliacetigena]|uniref:ArsA family ATPase n=1 Tax=Fuchsiella alkaliacetigena TaxID=957042 RepID=UPI002009E220|nr:ArsA family ATPase [Fuchsiella alkaliacetigena]MCK8825127.1 ArsA family ATPase [Fuchsiella alkaliacetigena]
MKKNKVIMFGGKGGVGKTTCAGATALHYAQQGQQTLIISTDSNPSLADIFKVQSTSGPAEVLENLHLAELGVEEVKEMWDQKFGQEVYEIFSAFVDIEYQDFVDFITSILPGLQEEFIVDYIRELHLAGDYQRIIWDTAPLGQTMSLLQMPAMLREHLKAAPRIYSKLKTGEESRRSIFDIIKGWEELSQKNIDFLRQEVQFNMVTIPEALAVEQLNRAFAQLNEYGFKFSNLIVNNVIKNPDSDFLRQKSAQQVGYLHRIYREHGHLEIIEVPVFPHEIRGLEVLEKVSKELFA